MHWPVLVCILYDKSWLHCIKTLLKLKSVIIHYSQTFQVKIWGYFWHVTILGDTVLSVLEHNLIKEVFNRIIFFKYLIIEKFNVDFPNNRSWSWVIANEVSENVHYWQVFPLKQIINIQAGDSVFIPSKVWALSKAYQILYQINRV